MAGADPGPYPLLRCLHTMEYLGTTSTQFHGLRMSGMIMDHALHMLGFDHESMVMLPRKCILANCNAMGQELRSVEQAVKMKRSVVLGHPNQMPLYHGAARDNRDLGEMTASMAGQAREVELRELQYYVHMKEAPDLYAEPAVDQEKAS